MCQTFTGEKTIIGSNWSTESLMCTLGESEHFCNNTLTKCIFALLTAKFQTLACSISVQILLPNSHLIDDEGPWRGPETAVDIY